MSNSHITNLVNAIVNKISTLITSHNNSDDAHSSLFSNKADAGHSHSYNDLSNKPTIPSANSTATNIKMDGTQSAGSLSSYAKADHVHPTDTGRAAATHSHTKSEITDFPTSMTPTSHASTATTYGASSASNYGHAMASSTTPKVDGTAAIGSETAKFARGDHVHPSNVDYVVGTQTASTSAWTAASSKISAISAGTILFYKLPYASTSTNVTLDLTLSGGGTTGAKNVFYNNTTRVTTQYGVGAVVGLVYDGTQWRVIDPYTNSTYSAVTQSANGLMTSADKTKLDKSMTVLTGTVGGTTSAYTVTITGVTLTHGTLIALYNAQGANAANATLNVNSLGAKPIYYNASAIAAGRYPNKSTCLFMYNTSIVSTGCWQLIYSYDSNTTYTAESTATNIKMNGTQAVGSLSTYARGDHVHPVDTSRAPTSHASTATTYGVSSKTNYGHAMASSTTPKANGTASVGSETAKFAMGDHVHPHSCVNNLTSTSTTTPLAANQGKVLNEKIAWKSDTPVTGVTYYYNDFMCFCVINYSCSAGKLNATSGTIDANANSNVSGLTPPVNVLTRNNGAVDLEIGIATDGALIFRSAQAINSATTVKGIVSWPRV